MPSILLLTDMFYLATILISLRKQHAETRWKAHVLLMF